MRSLRRSAGRWLARLDQRPFFHRIVVRMLPRAIGMRFDHQSAADLDAVFELAIRDPRGRQPERFELAIADQRCQVRARTPERPGARAVVGSDDLILLACGAARWPELLSSGRFELSGDPFLALRFASLFRLPVELDPMAGAQR
jgi:hypothetical protein